MSVTGALSVYVWICVRCAYVCRVAHLFVAVWQLYNRRLSVAAGRLVSMRSIWCGVTAFDSMSVGHCFRVDSANCA
jgi:hypothetical protein